MSARSSTQQLNLTEDEFKYIEVACREMMCQGMSRDEIANRKNQLRRDLARHFNINSLRLVRTVNEYTQRYIYYLDPVTFTLEQLETISNYLDENFDTRNVRWCGDDGKLNYTTCNEVFTNFLKDHMSSLVFETGVDSFRYSEYSIRTAFTKFFIEIYALKYVVIENLNRSRPTFIPY